MYGPDLSGLPVVFAFAGIGLVLCLYETGRVIWWIAQHLAWVS